jgi:hypothetical protein
MFAVLTHDTEKSILKPNTLEILQTLYRHGVVGPFLDGKGAPENLDNITQPIGIAMFALADVVYSYAR